MKYAVVLFVLIAETMLFSAVYAQTTFINPNGTGGYTAITPGQPSTFINPNGRGGFTAITPGQGTTFVNPYPSVPAFQAIRPMPAEPLIAPVPPMYVVPPVQRRW